MNDHHQRLLAHVAQYTVSVGFVMKRLQTSQEDTARVVSDLVKRGMLAKFDGIPGKLHYYQLTSEEANRQGNLALASPLSKEKLSEKLSVLWACCVSHSDRSLISLAQATSYLEAACSDLQPEQIEEIFRIAPPSTPHFLLSGGIKAICRITVAPTSETAADLAQKFDETVKQLRRSASLRHAINDGEYRFLVLLQSQGERKAFLEARRNLRSPRCKMTAELAPGLVNFKQVVSNALRREKIGGMR